LPSIYPAMISRVADAFRQSVTLNVRVKDGLAYNDAFDGREAVDKIAYIIKTPDRSLALLLGRALDAQKFFHDVTYDHRLRDSANELYQFQGRLATPFPSGELAAEDPLFPSHQLGSLASDAQNFHDQDGFLQPDSSDLSTADRSADGHAPSSEDVSTDKRNLGSVEEDPLPSGVFTLLTDCYSPTCSRDRLCYSIACPRRMEQQARLNMKPQPGLKRSISRESLGDLVVSDPLI
jgi:RHO1 GDP-GTP exchange protein 1/2